MIDMKEAHQRFPTSKGDIFQSDVWDVPISEKYPLGKKFSFVLIHERKRILGYDNCEGKGVHKHLIDLFTGQEYEIPEDEQDHIKIFRKFKKEAGDMIKMIYGE